uniref:TonB-dependent receptor n=1 Tax=uncultured Brevundimonas sp. TaxID=213418 RepID=UPI00260F5330
DYDLGGETDTYKIGADWAPVEDIRFRGSYQRAVRAPNVIELFTAQGFGLFDMDADPCGPAMTATLAECQATGVPSGAYGSGALDSPAGQYNFLGGGNPDLEPEESETLTFGAVFRPSFLPGFNLSVDWFNIKIEKLISSVGAVNVIDGCYTNNVAELCNLINRNAGGQLWIGEGHVVDLATNIGGLETTGVDVVANYGVDLADWGMGGAGSLAFSYVGTLLDELVTDTGLGFANSVYDCAGFFGTDACGQPNPEYRHRMRVTWKSPWDVDVSGTWRHYSEVEIGILGADGSLNNGGARIDRYFEAENYLDLAAAWQIRDDVRLRAGVNNVLDNDPPVSRSVGAGSGNGNTYPALYDALGRQFFFGITADF